VVRIYDKQLDAIAHAMGVDPVLRVEAHLRTHYPDQCDLYDPGALRAWIEDAMIVSRIRASLPALISARRVASP
jgi:hypothetical protein